MTIEEKNQIVLLYLDRHMGFKEILRAYSIGHGSDLQKWIKKHMERMSRYNEAIKDIPKYTPDEMESAIIELVRRRPATADDLALALAVDTAQAQELAEIKQELIDGGYIADKAQSGKKKNKNKNK